MKSKIGGIYEHYKKEKYIVYGIVNDCVGEEYVLYKGISKDTYCIRPKEKLFE